MRFARWVFAAAGIYGLIVTVPLFFLEERMNIDHPPPINHPEHYYGFVGVCAAFQVLFLVVARDPLRLRPVMPVAMLEKLAVVPIIWLVLQGRAERLLLGFAAIDLVLLALFAAAWWATRAPAEDARNLGMSATTSGSLAP
jgi:hypothetical protein